MEEISAAHLEVNLQRYGKLLAKARPMVIKTEQENERMLALVQKLMSKGARLTPEEGELLELVGRLIADFEEQFYQPEVAAPHEVLKELVDARGLKASDLVSVFGSEGRVSEVLNGKRAISKTQAKALARFFHVSPVLFI